MSLNRATLIGHVGLEPVVRWLDTGMCVATVRLATTEKGYTLQNGTQVPERTEWHNIVFWGKQAEVVESYVHKGDKLYVEGRIQSRSYDDRSGNRRQVVEIMANTLELLSGRQQSAQASSATSTTSQIQPSASDQSGIDDIKMPF